MRKKLLSFLAVGIFLLTGSNADAVDLHRFWSDTYKGHFYTTVETERQATSLNSDWEYEGVAYQAADESTGVPTHRFWSEGFKHHFFTTSENEKESIIANDKNWTYEGVGFYVATDGSPVYRFWSPIYNGHFYTNSEAEKQNLIDNDDNWTYEGIAWYAVAENQTITPESLTITITENEKETITEEEIAQRIVIENNIVIENIIGELPCFAQSDIDGDGWGWNGREGCRVSHHVPEEREEVYVCPANPIFRYYHDVNENGTYDNDEEYEWSTGLSGANVRQIYKDGTKISDDHFTEIDQAGSYHYFSFYYYGHTAREAGKSIQTKAYFDVDEYCNVAYPQGQNIPYVLDLEQEEDFVPNPVVQCSNVDATFTHYVDTDQDGELDSWEYQTNTSYTDSLGGYWVVSNTSLDTYSLNNSSQPLTPGDYRVSTGSGGAASKHANFRLHNDCSVEYTHGRIFHMAPERYFEHPTDPAVCAVIPQFTYYEDRDLSRSYEVGEPARKGTHKETPGIYVLETGDTNTTSIPEHFSEGSYTMTHRGVGGSTGRTMRFDVNAQCEISYPEREGNYIWYGNPRTSYPVAQTCNAIPQFRIYEDRNLNRQFDEGEGDMDTYNPGYASSDLTIYEDITVGNGPNSGFKEDGYDIGEYRVNRLLVGSGGSSLSPHFTVNADCSISYPDGQDVWYLNGRTSYPR